MRAVSLALAVCLSVCVLGEQPLRRRAQTVAAIPHQCTPELPDSLIVSPAVLQHPAVVEALSHVDQLMANITNDDALSVALVHASSPQLLYTFNKGRMRLNESSTADNHAVDNDSIFRVSSVTKSINQLTGLVLEKEAASRGRSFNLGMRLKDALPQFGLQPSDWNRGGSEITLDMLAAHTSGLPREGYTTDFDLITGMGRATADYIGDKWSAATPEQVLASVAQQGLAWAPGMKVSYSNAGYNILGYAIQHSWNNVSGLPTYSAWSGLAQENVLNALDMTHSSFGAVPCSLRQYASVPYPPSWIDRDFGPGYDPAAGMFSSSRDLAGLLYKVWLAAEPQLITKTQRSNSLKPSALLGDNLQAVGAGWEINNFHLDGSLYSTYSKSGDGGAQHAFVSLSPAFAYGLVILSSEGNNPPSGPPASSPSLLAESVHGLLLPAMRTAYTASLTSTYAGHYSPAPGVADAAANSSARITTLGDALHLTSLVGGSVDALLALDRISWTAPGAQPRYYSLGNGSALHPGPDGSWRLAADLDGVCDYLDFGGYTDAQGWPVDRVVLREEGGRVLLRYPPLNVTLVRDGA